MKALTLIHLVVSDAEHLFIYLLAICTVFFIKMPVQILCPFKKIRIFGPKEMKSVSQRWP